MNAVRAVVAAAGAFGVGAVMSSVIRTVVLPRAIPARLARIAFVLTRQLLIARLALTGRKDYTTRDHVFALQAPLGLFAQLFTWTTLIFVSFAGLFWGLSGGRPPGRTAAWAFEMAGSSMSTLGFDRPPGAVLQIVAFAASAVGLTLLALVITYLPTLYGAFSRREALITKLTVRSGRLPNGPAVLIRSWQLGRFDEIEEIWNAWEEWFVDLGESHTTFPQLGFFRSPHAESHWVLAAEAVLDAVSLVLTTLDLSPRSRGELCLDAGVNALLAIADFLGVPHRPPADEPEILLSRAQFDDACRRLDDLGVPLRAPADESWMRFRVLRARYEPLIAVLGRMTDAPRSEWSSWSDDSPRHSPPLLRLGRR
jgi:hypothetical protein